MTFRWKSFTLFGDKKDRENDPYLTVEITRTANEPFNNDSMKSDSSNGSKNSNQSVKTERFEFKI